MSGKFAIIDGLDGIGKGVIIGALVDYERNRGKKIFDLEEYWREHKEHPEPHELKGYDVVVSAEPTRAGTGNDIRKEMVADNQRDYSARLVANAFSINRMVLYKRIILPALAYGMTVIQSRSVVSSMTYQVVQAEEEGNKDVTLDFILGMEGNQFCLNHPPHLLIIPTIKNVQEVIERLAKREKKDHAIYENLRFQLKLKERYEDKQLREFFESKGTMVRYLDAAISIESTKEQVIKIWEEFLASQNVRI